MRGRLGEWIAHPLTRGLGLDDPRTTALRKEVIASKPFLHSIYQEWYALLAAEVARAPGPVLELGSGGGFLDRVVPGLVTSEPFFVPGVRVVADGTCLPFADASLGAVVLVDVLHHLPRPEAFFEEAARCLRPGGVVALIEPWVTPWARLVWRYLHHEPFDPQAAGWNLPAAGPLSGANSALPWMIFRRDLARFERNHPTLGLEGIKPLMPFAYLLSGGVSTRLGLPGWCYGPVRALEKVLERFGEHCCLFAAITLRKREN